MIWFDCYSRKNDAIQEWTMKKWKKKKKTAEYKVIRIYEMNESAAPTYDKFHGLLSILRARI